MQTGDVEVVAFVTPYEVGDTFEEWPLHVTLQAWARGERTPVELATALQEKLRGIASFKVTVGPEVHFADGTVLVNEIIQETPLHDLHELAKAAETELNFEYVALEYPEYRPHVTVQESARLQAGDMFMCDKLCIVQQQGDYKEIVAEVSLGTA